MEKEKDVNVSPTLADVFDDTSITENESSPYGGNKKKNKGRRKKMVLNLKCPLCEGGVSEVTYKDVYQLKKFTSMKGKIISTEKSGVCRKHQRQITESVKRARVMALLPYAATE